jgi:peptidoglycan hydrolase CwlO-like protein
MTRKKTFISIRGLLFMLAMIPSTLRAACVDETLECKNQQIAELNARIEALEIENAELKYDVSELKPTTRALKKELNQCKVNLKNVRSVVEGCYE